MGRIWKMNPSGNYSNSRDDKQANKQHKHPKLISCLLSAPLCCSSRGTGLHFPCHNSLGAPLQDLMRLSQPRDWRKQFFDLKIKRSKKNLLLEKTPQSNPAHSYFPLLPVWMWCWCQILYSQLCLLFPSHEHSLVEFPPQLCPWQCHFSSSTWTAPPEWWILKSRGGHGVGITSDVWSSSESPFRS